MERIAHYNLLEKIGSGGMGEAYRARDTKFGRTVVIKLLPDAVAADAARRQQFQREARAAAAISHPNVATLFEVGEDGSRLFVVFEFVPGHSLQAEIGGRPMNTRHAVALAVQLADAVADAHAAGIVHYDLKPENIFVTPKGNAKILDFGLANWTRGGALRRKARAAETAGPAPGVALATLGYLSPEQASGRAVDHRTDIFSLGVVIFEMLTGSNPFAREGGAPGAVASIRQREAPLPSSVNRDLPEELDPILKKALAKNPDDRYASAVSLTAELRAAAAILDVRSGDAEPPVLVARAPAGAMPWRGIASAILIVALLAGAWLSRDALWGLWRQYATPPPEPIVAVQPLEVVDAATIDFADGLADDLITRLGQIPGLTVVGRSAMRRHRGSDPSKIAADLGAQVVLTGSVGRSGDELRVTIALVDPKDGVQVWTQQFDRPLRRVLAMQTDIAEQVARALQIRLVPSAARARTAARTVDIRAYERYLQARDASARRDRLRAIELSEQALAVDPNLAEAHAELALAVYLEAADIANFDDPALVDRVRRSATNAINLDPDLARAQMVMGLVAPSLAEAIEHLKRAMAIDPTDPETLHHLGNQIVAIDAARAVALYRRSLELEPRLDATWADLALAYLRLDQDDRLNEAARQAASAVPGTRGALWAAAVARWRAGDAASLLATAHQAVDSMRGQGMPAAQLLLARAQLASDQADEARQTLRTLADEVPQYCEGRALLAGVLQDAGHLPEARAIVDQITAEASADSATPQLARCAATAVAALGDAAETSGWLLQIAGDQERLRGWGLPMAGFSGDLQMRLRLYPWNRVAEAAPVLAARAELDKAYGRLRPIVAEKLAGFP